MIYLDNASTSYPKPENVYLKLGTFLREAGGNPSRGSYYLATQAEQVITNVRIKLAKLIGSQTPEQIIFTLNASDALNMAIKGVLQENDHVITTELEHNSVLRPLAGLQSTKSVKTTIIPFDSNGFIDPEDVQKAITPLTKMVILTHASNVLGTIQPIEEVGKIAHEHNLIFLVDASQTAGIIPVNVQASFIDLLAAAGHKGLLGPQGTGFLYVGNRVSLNAWREGGTGGNSLLETQPKELPYWLESGTPNTVGLAALGEALDYITTQGMDNIHNHEKKLFQYLMEELNQLPKIFMYGSSDLKKSVSVKSFTLEEFEPHETAIILDSSYNIAVRGGLHCAPYTHKRLCTAPLGTTRISIGAFNVLSDIEQLVIALKSLTKA